jgi:prolipoprotein diacylglyceryltransferase
MDASHVNTELYFRIFYLLSFAFIFITVIYNSLKRGYHLRSVLLMLTTITLLTIIGSRLFTIPISEYMTVLNSETSFYNNRSAIGALLFGLIGLLISQRIFGFNRPILDLYAWIVPIALGIQKIGCFFNGCCYGKPSDIFWSIQYPIGTHAHFNQWASGLIQPDAAISSAVHPVQLYETLFLFIIGLVVWKTHNYWKKNASAILFSLFLFFMFRFGIEFIRDPEGSQFNISYFLGLRVFQWGILVFGILSGFLLLVYENYIKRDYIKGQQNSPYLHADLIYIISISAAIYIFKNLFSNYELLALWMKFLPAILLSFHYLLTENKQKTYRLITSIVILVPFYVLAQTIPSQKAMVEKYKRIDFGGSFGNFSNHVSYNPQQGECGTIYTNEYYKHIYSLGGVGYSQVVKKNYTTSTYGVNVHAGSIKTTSLTTNTKNSEFVFAANPYYRYDGKWFGGGLGFQVGDLRINKNELINAATINDAQKSYNILPEFYLRVGRRDYLDIDYNYGFLFPSPYPTLNQRISIGSGFGLSSDYSLRYGKFYPLESNFISAEALINNQFGVNLMYILKEPSDFTEIDNSGKIIFSINYRFDNKKN